MIKELKYLFYVFFILFFLFYSTKYYFSEKNIKKISRLILNIESMVNTNENEILTLENNTENIVEYVENNPKENKKKYFFWKLLDNNG